MRNKLSINNSAFSEQIEDVDEEEFAQRYLQKKPKKKRDSKSKQSRKIVA